MPRCRPAVLLTLLLGLSPAVAGPPTADLTAAQRRQLDRAAAAFPPDDPAEEVASFAGNPAAWVIVHVTLTPDEEVAAAKRADEEVLKKYRTVAAPKEVEQVFAKLVATLPGHMKPDPIRFTLTVLDTDTPAAFTVGGGFVYVTRPLLDVLLASKERGPAAVAFVLANEIGHVARLHCRRGHQFQLIEEELKNGALALKGDVVRHVLGTTPAPAGVLAKFVYADFQEDEADLFAVQLCRNAGIDLDQALDALRWFAAIEAPAAMTDPKFQPDPKADRSAEAYYLSSHPPALRRLKRMNLEGTGGVEAEDEAKYGLFVYDRAAGKLTKAADGAVGVGEKSVIFVHGLHGDDSSFTNMMEAAAKSDDLRQAKLLFCRYPNNTSLARCGELLTREVARVVRTPGKASFVGHSAGGLVTRYYVERKKGEFDRAVFIATPHHGSSLTRVKYLLDAGTFLDRTFRLDLLEATRESIAEGLGEMGYDLEPDSLFLRYLDAEPKTADRYYCVYGRAQKKAPGLPVSLLSSFATTLRLSRPLLKRQLTASVKSEVLKGLIREGIDQLDVPPELLDGDLVVSAYSARLTGAKETIETDLDHVAIVRDRDVIEKVLPIVAGR